jgi:hypothetical protein
MSPEISGARAYTNQTVSARRMTTATMAAISLSQGRGKRGLQLRQEARRSRPTPTPGACPHAWRCPSGMLRFSLPSPPEQTLTLADGCS